MNLESWGNIKDFEAQLRRSKFRKHEDWFLEVFANVIGCWAIPKAIGNIIPICGGAWFLFYCKTVTPPPQQQQ